MAEEKKKSVILYEDTIDALIKTPNENMAKIVKAILCSVKGIELPELDPMEEVLFEVFYGQVERAAKLSKDRSEAGSSKKKPAQGGASGRHPESNGEQAKSNAIQTSTSSSKPEANAEQTETTVSKPESNPNTVTSTVTITSTVTDTLTGSSARARDAADAARLENPPAFEGQVFESVPCERQDGTMQEIFDFWKNNMGEPPANLHWIVKKVLDAGMETALICYGIEKSVPATNPVFYFNKLMNDWKKEGILTLKAYEAAHPETIPRFSGGASSGPRAGKDGLGTPSYDLDEINRLILESQIKGAGSV